MKHYFKKLVSLMLSLALVFNIIVIPTSAYTLNVSVHCTLNAIRGTRYSEYRTEYIKFTMPHTATDSDVFNTLISNVNMQYGGVIGGCSQLDLSCSSIRRVNSSQYDATLSYSGANVTVECLAQLKDSNGSYRDYYGLNLPRYSEYGVNTTVYGYTDGLMYRAMGSALDYVQVDDTAYQLNRSACSISGGGVNYDSFGQCSQFLRLAYDPVCLITYQFNGAVPVGATLPSSHKAQPGTSFTIAANPTVPGYAFSGWSAPGVTLSGRYFTVPSADDTFSGSWSPKTDTPYTVQLYKQHLGDNGYTFADTITGKGTTDTQIRAALDMAALDGKYPYHHLTSASKADTTTIGANGTSVLKLYYDVDTANVSYLYSDTVPKKAPALPTATTRKYGTAVTIARTPELPGYDFSGWVSEDADITSGTFTMSDQNVTITGSWTPHIDTPYVVEYYLQNLNDDDYVLVDTEHCTGTTDTIAIVSEKTYPGFTMTPGSVTAATTTNIDGEGTTILKLYFDRNVNTVTYAYSGETDVTPPVLPTEATYRYGQVVTLDTSKSTLQGYEFGGWEVSGAEVFEGKFIMPDGPVTITGEWIPRTDTPFTVEYYQQNLVDNQYKLAYTFNGKGTTGKNVLHKEFIGFTEVPDSVTAEGNAKISSDGSTILKLYYDRSSYQVSFSYSGAAPEDAPPLPAKEYYRYGAEVTIPEIPGALSGMRFSGWFTGEKCLSEKAFTVPAQDTQIIGGWSEIHYSDSEEPDLPITKPIPVQTLEDNGSAYIIGYDDGTFRPDDFLTAKQEAFMLSRLGLSVTPLSTIPENLDDAHYITRREFLSALLDASGASVPEVSNPMAQAAAQGWINGYANGELYPDAYVTRAQAVTIINRAFGRTAMQDIAYEISYADLPRNHWAYDAVIAASTTM